MQDELLIAGKRFEIGRFHDECPQASGRFIDGRRSWQELGIVTILLPVGFSRNPK
jgi:hypothetical protein